MLRRTTLVFALLACFGATTAIAATAPAPLTLQVYNPGARSMFPVSSEIISGAHDAVLIDAQFQRNDAQALVEAIRASGKTLTTVYISHSDPDYYFGLDVIHAAFPDARIVATAPTVAAMKSLMQRKLEFWGPQLKDNKPQALVLPQVLQGDHLTLEGHRLQIKGLDGPTPARSYVWIPSLKTVLGGAVVFSGSHVWVADTPTAASRQQWQATLKTIEALKPVRVVPGHYLGLAPAGLAAVRFNADYLTTFDAQAVKAGTAEALVAAMETAYPDLPERGWLELGARVVKGDMAWPQ
ncbi:MBL fold metallo-hydrolase [Dyella sp.]|jgi:glyoxylase-like metal-dependent hydrolase (beta-lactamase superfamily II)|uniref:MBL fold metallo-hydrolase n=1 Tax=Dyella sp. TaxID=1869338 RepID=UPI002D77F113|nr:MBL fold metallo-hydrolase [Dyella sp.]HET6432473.1 MBL fold metallo-hydrolase [Dyella sp.]